MKGPRKRSAKKSPVTNKNADQPCNASRSSFSRCSFFRKGLVGASTVAVVGLSARRAEAEDEMTPGDAAILRFLAAAEILETDAWQQYNELGGIQDSEVPGGSGSPAYTAALAVLDSDMAQYIHDNTEDEMTHELFLNAYLTAHGTAPANLEPFRNL